LSKSSILTDFKNDYIICVCSYDDILPIIYKYYICFSLGIFVFYIDIVGNFLIIFLFYVGYNLTGNS